MEFNFANQQDQFISQELIFREAVFSKTKDTGKISYFNVRKFRVQKISRISRMIPQFAKLNGREKNILANPRKLIPTRHDFFAYLEHKIRLFSLFYSYFCLGKSNLAKINSRKMN